MPSPVRYHQNHSPLLSVLHFSAVLSVTMVWLLFVPPHFSIVMVRLLGGKISPGLTQMEAGIPGMNSTKWKRCLRVDFQNMPRVPRAGVDE